MVLLLQTASTFVIGMALTVLFTMILAIGVSYLARRERNKRITRLPKLKGVKRSQRRRELAIRRKDQN